METLAQLRTRVWDRLGSDEFDAFFPARRVTDALNIALVEAADRLALTVARRRYQKRLPDLSTAIDFDPVALSWVLPFEFRRIYRMYRGTTDVGWIDIKELSDESEFDSAPPNYFLVFGRTLQLSAGTDPVNTVVWYVYKPAPLVLDDDKPDFVSGYEEYLAAMACVTLVGKADAGDPTIHLNEANRIWPALSIAARNSGLPATIHKRTTPFGEDWYG